MNAPILTVDQDVDVLFLAGDFVYHLYASPPCDISKTPSHPQTQSRKGGVLTLDALLGRSIPLNSVHAPVPRLGRGRLHGLLQDLGSSAGDVHLGAVSSEGDGGGQPESGTSCESKLRVSNRNVSDGPNDVHTARMKDAWVDKSLPPVTTQTQPSTLNSLAT
jgi:hypothetical protein